MAAYRVYKKPETLQFSLSNASKSQILRSLYEQTKEGRFCDIILKLAGHEFPAHGCVLAANSVAFTERLIMETGHGDLTSDGDRCGTNRNVTTIDLNNGDESPKITPAVFSKVLQFMYTGVLDIMEDDVINIEDIRQATQLLQLSGVQEPFQELHTTRVYKTLCEQRRLGDFCDVAMLVDGQRYRVHRCLLAAVSPYFDAMFSSDMSEKDKAEIAFPALTNQKVSFLLGYIYNDTITLTVDNLEDCLEVADFFHIPSMKDRCSEFLCMDRIIDATNCIKYKTLAETFTVDKAYMKAKKFIALNFVDVIREDEVLALSVGELMELISDSDNVVEIVHKGKVVETEICIFDAVLRWIDVSVSERKEYFNELLTGVRLQLITSPMERKRILSCPMVQNCSACLQKVLNAFESAPTESPSKDVNVQPRRGELLEMISVVGATGSMMSSKMTSYIVNDNKWTARLEIPISLQYAAASFYNNRLYLSGGLIIKYRHRGHFGSATEISKSLYSYDPLLHHWTRLPDMLECRYHHQLVACNNALYALGGQYNIGNTATNVQCYSLQEWDWKLISRPKRLASFQNKFLTYTWNNNIYVISIESLKTSGTIDMYNTQTDEWSLLVFNGFSPKVPFKLVFCLQHPCLADCEVYVTDFHTVHHVFNLVSQEWRSTPKPEMVTTPPTCEYVHNAVVVNNKVYILGFRLWVFDFHTKQWDNLTCYKGYFSKGVCGLLKVPSQFVYQGKEGPIKKFQ